MFKCLVLAGGKGTRLKSVVSDIPKPLAPICGVPFLSFLLNKLDSTGIRDIIISTGYMSYKIENHFGSSFKNSNIQYVRETSPLGTGGAIVNAIKACDLSEPFILVNGDTFFDINYTALEKEWRRQECKILIAVRKQLHADRYGTIRGKNGVVLSFLSSPNTRNKLSNSGSYIIDPSIFNTNILPSTFSFETEFIPMRVDEALVRYIEMEGYFIDIGIPSDYARAQLEVQNFNYF